MSKKNVLFIVGSLRKESFNSTVAKYVEEVLEKDADVEYLDYSKLPYLNQDSEFPTPEEVLKVREKVSSADGIWIFSPEYNFQIPGALKNLLDWLSRPLKPFAFQDPTAISNKKITISGAAGSSKAEGVRKQLSELLKFIRAEVVYGEGTGIELSGEAFQTNKLVLSDENKSELQKQSKEFLEKLN
ncbi:NAD(P)H-dependent oxidoreductase [Leptotrichia sp. OH3620_COT-345]|uniref:NADPH-dependent FMN reductase n=1 Tax=Leptotrichia sp. OH3620_COT-345 TaxID=2491048 RepID=UPI000F64C560|nr:NADPH-dependent FMN reductase [Leptotrichia sp. OH3620_COT-345]RRD39339.1 NAD(P)H-dependent oxidoreductase [Leptotrichia sp. OH3620_COT-345]